MHVCLVIEKMVVRMIGWGVIPVRSGTHARCLLESECDIARKSIDERKRWVCCMCRVIKKRKYNEL